MTSKKSLRKEWATTRQLISDSDDRLTDLRKYGLSFVAALLAAQGLTEFPLGSSSSTALLVVPAPLKFVIILASLLLLCGMVSMERVILSIQIGGVQRARVLERLLGLDLTESISDSYAYFAGQKWNHLVYVLFISATGSLGYFVIHNSGFVWDWFTALDIVATVAAGLFVILGSFSSKQKYLVDWKLDQYECLQNGTVGICLTNLSPTPIPIVAGRELWRMLDSNRAIVQSGSLGAADWPIEPGEMRTWYWHVGQQARGTYWLLYATGTSEWKRLGRPLELR